MAPTTEAKKPTPLYQDVDGFRIPGMFSADAYRSAIAYKPRPDDLFIVTYPKCGTTWVQHIIGCIFRKGQTFTSFTEFLMETPFLEMTGAEAAHTMKRPGAIKFHLPFYLTPYSPEAKYIFVARNPKDCLVSFYHHTENIPGYQFTGGDFDDFFELFIEGKTDFGDYFDTLLSWYEHRNDPNVLFITYEQLKKNTKAYILKIAEFMGSNYKEMLESDEQILKDVIHHSSFKYMKETSNKSMAEMSSLPKEFIENNPDIPPGLRDILLKPVFHSEPTNINFVRKGIVGDWKNYLSPMQNARLERKYRERTRGTDIPNLWKDGVDFVEKMMRPGPIKTHLPFHLTPFSKDAKYIYVTRNPKDCCVSFFHHMRNSPGFKFNGTFDEFFELFVSGKIDFGDYFDNLLSWYPHRNDPNVLFVTYEELKEDIDAAILKMASFIDDEEYAEPIRKDPKILENIKKYSSLKEMKEFMTRSFVEVAEMSPEELQKSHLPDMMKQVLVQQKDKLKASLEGKEEGPSMAQFVRKGIVGDWKNYFSEDQSRRLEEKFAERTKGTEIANFWKQYM